MRWMECQLLLASWIDNMYAAGSCTIDACDRLLKCEVLLSSCWQLDVKPSSMKIVSSSRAAQNVGSGRFSWASPFPVLGALIGPCGSASEDFSQASRSVWKRFWCGAGSRKARRLPLSLKLRDLERCCFPAVSGRCSWWPIGIALLAAIRALQGQLVASLLRVPKEPGEDDAAYARRRGREAQSHIVAAEAWGLKAARQVVRWHDHLQRRHVDSWACKFFHMHDNRWLQLQRLLAGSVDTMAGILGMREVAGRPRVRYEDGVRFLLQEFPVLRCDLHSESA